MTQEEALELIERLPFITTLKLPNEKVRMSVYEASIESDDPIDWVKVIKSSYVREHAKPGATAQLDKQEIQYVESARKRLQAELAEALSIQEEEVDGYIVTYLQQEGLL
jgi:CarD family transcriptional regulator